MKLACAEAHATKKHGQNGHATYWNQCVRSDTICAMDTPREKIITFVRNTLARYPLSTSRDIYKLLYQSYHGAEHAISDDAEARRWLDKEWSGLGSSKGTKLQLIEDIHIDEITPELYRLNLVPAKLAGINPGIILEEFLRAASEFPTAYPGPDNDLHLAFTDVWSNLGNAIESGEIGLMLDDYREITSLAESNDWPAIHHSGVYRENYRPHYRLIINPSRILPFSDFPPE